MTAKTPSLPIHGDDCLYGKTGAYTVGCVGCVHQLISDSKNALVLQYNDTKKELNEEQKKELEERIEVYIYLQGMFP